MCLSTTAWRQVGNTKVNYILYYRLRQVSFRKEPQFLLRVLVDCPPSWSGSYGEEKNPFQESNYVHPLCTVLAGLSHLIRKIFPLTDMALWALRLLVNRNILFAVVFVGLCLLVCSWKSLCSVAREMVGCTVSGWRWGGRGTHSVWPILVCYPL